jgi:ferredoxin-type protein NapG
MSQFLKSDEVARATRRFFLAAVGGIGALLGLGVVGKAMKRNHLLRPPGGQNETAFLAKCLKCDRCRSICPTSVIGVAHLEDGLLEARTPVMKFHLGDCTLCKKCVAVCPTGALEPFEIKTVRIGIAVVQREICIAWNSGGCTVCHSACVYQAITLDGQRQPYVDASKCNGCGRCEHLCPVLSLRAYLGGNTRGIEIRPSSFGDAA